MNINLDKQSVDLSIERDKYPMQLGTGNPFMISQGFDLMAKDKPSTDFAVQEDKSNKIDEGVLRLLDKQVTLALNRTTRIPNNVQSLSNLGVSHLNRRNYDTAILIFLEALKINRTFMPALANLAKAYLFKGNVDESLNIYNELEKIYPCNTKILNNMACIFVMKRDLKKAEAYLLRIIQIDENNEDAYNNLGLIQLMVQQTDKAIKSFRKAITINNNFANAYNNIGICYILRKDYRKAIKYLLASWSFNKLDVDTLINLAIAYQGRGHHEEVAKFLSEYLYSGHMDYRISELLAQSYFELKRYKKALDLLSSMLRNEALTEVKRGRALNNIGVTYQRLNDNKAAEKYYNMCLEMKDGKSALYFNNLVKLYLSERQYESAKDIIDKGMIEFPDDANLMGSLGMLYFEIGNYKKSSEILYNVMEIKPDLIDSYTGLSVIEMEINNDFEKAHEILMRGISFNKENVLLLNNLAYNYLLREDTVSARRILDKVRADDSLYINATRGLLLIKEGNIEEGRRLYRQAELLANKDESIKNLVTQKMNLELARHFYKEGNMPETAAYLRKILKVNARYNYYREQASKLISDIGCV